jgi:SOR/SNZ family
VPLPALIAMLTETHPAMTSNGTTSNRSADFLVKAGLAQMLKGGVIMDVVNAEQVRCPFFFPVCPDVLPSLNTLFLFFFNFFEPSLSHPETVLNMNDCRPASLKRLARQP